MRPHCTSGQAAVEYIAVVALVAIVFAVAGAFTLQGRAIAAATAAELRRGLCLVGGHDCADPHEPCSVSSRGSGSDMNVDVALVRLGGGSAALIDHRSDGKVLVTVTDHLDAGISVGVGGQLEIGGRPALGGELRGAAIAGLGHGTAYVVSNDSQAEALLRLLHRPKVDPSFYTPAVRAYWRRVESVLPRIPAATTRYRSVEGGLSLAGGVLGADAVAGMREDQISHRRTYYLKASVALDAGSAGGSANGQIAVTVDRRGRPVDLALIGSGDLNVSADLPLVLQPVAGHLTAAKGRSWELEGHLHLTQPGGPSVRSLLVDPAALLRRVLAAGSVQMRSYGASRRTAGVAGGFKLGVGLGAGLEHTTSTQRLLAAMDHTREGFWVPRYDCLYA